MKRDRSALICTVIYLFLPENLLLNQGCVLQLMASQNQINMVFMYNTSDIHPYYSTSEYQN
jgi:hypothetical protein